jgi:hypothetical protein
MIYSLVSVGAVVLYTLVVLLERAIAPLHVPRLYVVAGLPSRANADLPGHVISCTEARAVHVQHEVVKKNKRQRSTTRVALPCVAADAHRLTNRRAVGSRTRCLAVVCGAWQQRLRERGKVLAAGFINSPFSHLLSSETTDHT